MKKITILLILVFGLLNPVTTLALVKNTDAGTVVDPREYPIIFVPGAAGSLLEAGGYNAWPGSVSITDSAFNILALEEDGRTPCCGSRAIVTGVMRYGGGDVYTGLGDWQFAAVYQGFYDYMEKEGYGYNVPSEDGKVFFDFPYDWRQDNHRWTVALDKKVDRVLKQTKADKVILYGHSMGGLQIRLYLADSKRAEKVGGVVFMGTPHNGAPQVFWAYTYGYNFGNSKVDDTTMWEIMKNWPAGYQLLPDYGAVQRDDGSFWTVEEMYGPNFISQQEYDHYIDAGGAESDYQITYGLPNETFRNVRVAFAEELTDAVSAYDWIDYYMIAGTGIDTVQYFEASLVDVGLEQPLLQLEKVITKNGDGTVPKAGARVEGVVEHIEVAGEHSKLPSEPVVHGHLNRIKDLLNDVAKRDSLLRKQENYAAKELNRVASWNDGTAPDTEALPMIFFHFLRGDQVVKDEQRRKFRDKLRGYAIKTFENATVNVIIENKETKETDTYYGIIKNFELVESGKGNLKKSDVKVRIDTTETLNGILGDTISEESALLAAQVQITGGGIVVTFVSKLYGWIRNFTNRG